MDGPLAAGWRAVRFARGFVGEVLGFICAWGTDEVMGTGFRTLVFISATSVVITAAYYLWTMQRMFLGGFNERWKDLSPNLTVRERITLYPLAAMSILVHGLRLNVLEFSNHMSLEWSGHLYDPFRKNFQTD